MKTAVPKKRNPVAGVVRRALREMEPHQRGTIAEPALINLAIQDHLLGKLNLEKKQLEKAKQISAHTYRLQQATTAIANEAPITVRMAKDIISKTLESIPGFLERNERMLPVAEVQHLAELQKNLSSDLNKMSKWDPNHHTSLTQEFLSTAAEITFNELCSVLGDKKFDEYLANQRRAQRFLANAAGKGLIGQK